MKILMINSVCGIGSTGRICTDLAETLSQNGHEVKIAYGRGNVPEKYIKYAVRIGSNLGVRLHGLEARIFDNTGFGSKSATKKFIDWVKEFNPDVIHIHNIHGYYINLEELFQYLAKANKRVIWTLHDCWAITGHCAYFDYVGCDKWKNGCGNCPQKNSYPSSIICDNSRANWEKKKKLFTSVKNMTIITPSKWLAGLVNKSFFDKYPVKVINNGIDTSVFKPTYSDFRDKYDLKKKKIILGVASVWERRKGLDDFIKLSKMLDDDYKIVLVGLTEKQLKTIPDNILGIARTNSTKELAEIYTVADIFLNLTYEDNYPTVNLEAQACGTPVITYHTGGSVESCIPENCVKQGDLDGVIEVFRNDNRNTMKVMSTKEMCLMYISIYYDNI